MPKGWQLSLKQRNKRTHPISGSGIKPAMLQLFSRARGGRGGEGKSLSVGRRRRVRVASSHALRSAAATPGPRVPPSPRPPAELGRLSLQVGSLACSLSYSCQLQPLLHGTFCKTRLQRSSVAWEPSRSPQGKSRGGQPFQVALEEWADPRVWQLARMGSACLERFRHKVWWS